MTEILPTKGLSGLAGAVHGVFSWVRVVGDRVLVSGHGAQDLGGSPVGPFGRIAAWVTVTGFVQAEPGYPRTTAVINAFSELIVEVFGDEIGQHARTAIGVAALPLNLPVVVAAELSLARVR